MLPADLLEVADKVVAGCLKVPPTKLGPVVTMLAQQVRAKLLAGTQA